MTTIHARVTRTECSLQIDGCLTSGMVGVPVSFEFGPEWKGLKKTAVFHAGTVKRDRINIERSTTVPAEVLQKPMENLYIGIYGYREDGTIVIPTVMAKAGIILQGANPSGDPGADPNLPIWAELEQRVSDLEEGSGDAAVKSVNGITPDENGNVEIKIPESSGSSVTIDPTLTQSGQAADAKAVGDAIANLDIPSIEGLATEEYVDTAIANIDLPSDVSGGDAWETIIDYTVPEECAQVLLTTDINGNAFSLKRAIVVCLVYPLAVPAKLPLRCTFDSNAASAYGAQHFWNGMPTTSNTAGKCTGFKLDVCKTNDGISVVNAETISASLADVEEEGDFMMAPTNIQQRYDYKTLSPIATGITAFGVGSYNTAIGIGTRIKLLGVRE